MEIRAATERDCEEVLALWRAAGAVATITDDVASLRPVVAQESVLVAEAEDGRLIGTVISSFDGWRGNMYRLAVAPGERRHGTARALVDAAEKRLVDLGCRRVTALVRGGEQAAEAFWSAVGYEHQEGTARYVKTVPAQDPLLARAGEGELSQEVPSLVASSKSLAERIGFAISCSDEVGRLLATLAASVPDGGRILELGTGAGVGTAWLCHGLGTRDDVEVVSVELDEARLSEVRKANWPRAVRFVPGDAVTQLGTLGGFDLVFADAPGGKWQGLALSLDAVRARGWLVVDDMTPRAEWARDQYSKQSAVRASILSDPRFVAVEMGWGGGVILAARRPESLGS